MSNSVALNIANQTDLTRGFERGFKQHKSPLRDYTKQDVEDINTALADGRTGGEASKFFGTLRILTGDFTGTIDLAGGFSAGLSHSEHPASRGRWIFAEDAINYASELEAERLYLQR